jgi:DNA-binding Lrp family transcriptional regulator
MKQQKKGDGCTAIKQYILDRVHGRPFREDFYVRITGQEIAAVVGLTSQSVNEHVRYLVRQGTIIRRRRCYFGDPSELHPGRIYSWMSDRLKKHDWSKEPVLLIDLYELTAATGFEGPILKTLAKEWIQQHGPPSGGLISFSNEVEEASAIPLETGSPRNAYEMVRDSVLEQIRIRSCKADLLIRLNSEEIAARIGLSPATVRRALRHLVRRGVLWRDGKNSPYYGAVAEIQREQLRAWIRYRMQMGVFSDEPLLLINPVHAATALQISVGDVSEHFRGLTTLDTAFRMCRLIDDTDDDPR